MAVNRAEIRSNPIKFIILAVSPIYLFTGPIPTSIQTSAVRINLRNTYRRFRIIQSDLIIGILFCFILSTPFEKFFYLRDSTNVVDIILFGIFFEFYVYFNFAGYSMITWSFMRLFGLNVQRNFNQPFSAVSLIDYWQRWHISLSTVLKELFFKRFRQRLSLYPTVIMVFFASALWHGLKINFLFWGLFHGTMWCFSHYLFLKKEKVLNYILYIFAVIFGRVLFAESRAELLCRKIQALIDVKSWGFMSSINYSILESILMFNLIFAILIIICEICIKVFNYSRGSYFYLKTPFLSVLITLYIILFITLSHTEPIYGIR